MSDLVRRLSNGDHPVEVTLRPERTAKALKAAVDRQFVHVKFTETRGGTELGIRLDSKASEFGNADFEVGRGDLKLVGSLKLDYVPVRCIARIGLDTFKGTGHLEISSDRKN